MMKRMMLTLCCAVILAGLSVPASASMGSGSIRIQVDRGNVMLYRVGDPLDTGYRLTEEFGRGLISWEDALSPNLALWLAERVHGGVEMDPTPEGAVVYPDLPEGLYLMVHTNLPQGEKGFDPFLISIPWDGIIWNVEADPDNTGKNPKTGDSSEILSYGFAGLFSFAALVLLIGRRKVLTNSCGPVIIAKHVRESVGMVDKHV